MKAKIFFLTVALLGYGARASAAERQYSYPAEGAHLQYFGNSKAETYDVAIRLVDPALVGKQIRSLTVTLCEGATATDPKGWLSSALLLDSKKKNAPDIALVDATLSADNVLVATFSEPYTIPAEGVYAGYSITIGKATTFGDQNPNPVAECVNTDGAYIHSTRTNLKWSSLAEYNVASTLEVTVSGDFPEYGVGVVKVADVRVSASDETVSVPVTLSNWGAADVSEVELNYSFGNGAASSVSATLPVPLSAKAGSTAGLTMTIPAYGESTTLSVAVTKVNGHSNEMAAQQASGKYMVMAFVPVTRPLMEEYTGLWCAWCPRGYVAMEEMSKLYPEDFVCVSYHDGDVLQYLAEYPTVPGGYPLAFMNRRIEADPYYGLSQGDDMGIKPLWSELREVGSPADISVEVSWTDDSRTALSCRSTLKFLEDCDGADYRVDYILLGDGFRTMKVYKDDGITLDMEKSVLLRQQNKYSGTEPIDDSEFWAGICDGPSLVETLVFNDVAMARSGAVEALPEAVKANQEYTHDFEFRVDGLVNVGGSADRYGPRDVMPADARFHVVAVLLSADGNVLNCNKSAHLEHASVADVLTGSGAEVEESLWFDLQGRPVMNPVSGIYIRVDRLADGTSRRARVSVK